MATMQALDDHQLALCMAKEDICMPLYCSLLCSELALFGIFEKARAMPCLGAGAMPPLAS